MDRKKLIIITIFLALLITSVHTQQSRGGRPGGSPGTGDRPDNNIGEAAVSQRHHTITVGGRLTPLNRVEHQAAATGYVASVFVRQGQYVGKGTELFSIERNDITATYKPVVVTARISGIVSEIAIQQQKEIRSGENGVTLIDTSGYILEASISDKDAFKVNTGEQVTGHTTAGAEVTGTLRSRSPEPDYATGLFFLTLSFSGSRDTHVGDFVTVDLPIDQVEGIFVNREHLLRRYGEYYMWVITDSDTLEARLVSVGTAFGDEVLITDGLAPAERYLTNLTGREKEGMKIGAAGE